jgi:P27 family predicted phage terminase small subunit
MGRRGPLPIPANIVALRGNPAKRRLPPPALAIPTSAEPIAAPDWLPDLARQEWERAGPELHALGLLTALDLQPFACYCLAVCRWRQAEAALDALAAADGELVARGAAGGMVAHPLLAIARESARAVVRYAAEFGMTPNSRARLRAGGGAPASRFDGLIG